MSEPLSKYVRVDASPARVERVWDGIAGKLGGAPKTGRRWALRAGLVAVAAVAAFVSVRAFTRHPEVLVLRMDPVEAGEDARTYGLVDGSRLELAAHTKLFVVGNDPSAMIQIDLQHGRVDCDVTPQPSRHFWVTAAGVRVHVKGTKFAVTLAPTRDHVQVDVERGRVEVSWNDDNERRQLAAGEHWSIDLKPSPAATSNAAALPTSVETANAGPSASVGGELPRGEAPSETPSAEPPKSAETAHSASVPGARELLDLGNAARRAGDIAAAARAYEQLLSLHPNDGRAGLAAFELGRLKMDRLGDVQGAIQALQKAVRLAPGGAFREDAMARLVDAYARAGMTDRCRSAQSSYLASYPTGVHASAVERACPKR